MPVEHHPPVSPNGAAPTGSGAGDPNAGRDEALASLRRHPENVHLFRGYGPLVVGIILFVLMVLLAPTVAPEKVVERPVNEPTTTEAAP